MSGTTVMYKQDLFDGYLVEEGIVLTCKINVFVTFVEISVSEMRTLNWRSVYINSELKQLRLPFSPYLGCLVHCYVQ